MWTSNNLTGPSPPFPNFKQESLIVKAPILPIPAISENENREITLELTTYKKKLVLSCPSHCFIVCIQCPLGDDKFIRNQLSRDADIWQMVTIWFLACVLLQNKWKGELLSTGRMVVWGMEGLDSIGQYKDFVYVHRFFVVKLTLLGMSSLWAWEACILQLLWIQPHTKNYKPVYNSRRLFFVFFFLFLKKNKTGCVVLPSRFCRWHCVTVSNGWVHLWGSSWPWWLLVFILR